MVANIQRRLFLVGQNELLLAIRDGKCGANTGAHFIMYQFISSDSVFGFESDSICSTANPKVPLP